MASDGNPVQIPVTSLVHGSQAPTTVIVQQPSGISLPPSGKAAAPAAGAPAAVAAKSSIQANAKVQAQVTLLNKYLNDSGRPDQFRVAPSSGDKIIQQVNPANGAVIGEFSSAEFPALARSVGVSGAIVDDHA
jgi:hypothetical protein